MIRAELSTAVCSHLDTVASDGLDIFLLESESVRGGILTATTLTNQMRANHHLGILETLGLGYGYMAALLASLTQKGRDRLSLELSCSGGMRGFSVESVATGTVRGYLYESVIPLTSAPDSFDLAPYIGTGSLTLRRFPEGAKEPVSGTTELRYSSIARDLTNHFRESEQTMTAVSLSIFFDPNGVLTGAGGLFLQALPDADPTVLEDLDEWLPTLPSLSRSLAQGETASHYLHAHFGAFSPRIIGTRPAEFVCSCSRQQFARYLHGLPTDQLRDLIATGPMPMELICHNCASVYRFDEVELPV